MVLGIVMQGMAFSWLYLVGIDCARHLFFRTRAVNDWVGTLLLAPLLHPLRVLRDSSRSSRALVSLLLSSLFGFSLSHVAVDCFLLVGVPLMWWRLGWLGVCKYWLLPLVFAHFNVGALVQKGDMPAASYLFPELKGEGERSSHCEMSQKFFDPFSFCDLVFSFCLCERSSVPASPFDVVHCGLA